MPNKEMKLTEILDGFAGILPSSTSVSQLTPIERIAIALESIDVSLAQLVNPNNGGLNVNADCHVSQVQDRW